MQFLLAELKTLYTKQILKTNIIFVTFFVLCYNMKYKEWEKEMAKNKSPKNKTIDFDVGEGKKYIDIK